MRWYLALSDDDSEDKVHVMRGSDEGAAWQLDRYSDRQTECGIDATAVAESSEWVEVIVNREICIECVSHALGALNELSPVGDV